MGSFKAASHYSRWLGGQSIPITPKISCVLFYQILQFWALLEKSISKTKRI
jgi:hypothetical protein